MRAFSSWLYSPSPLRARLDDRLGDDPQADHRVADHQDEHGNLAADGRAPGRKRAQRDDVGHVHRDDMADDDRDDGPVPDESGADDSYVRAIAGGAPQVPAEPERVGSEPDHELALDQQITEVVSQVIGDRDRHE